jgi:hypothetical protein
LVAPSAERSRLEGTLRALREYRREEGLYETWLAPPSEHQCIAPGEERNPVDMGLGMHVYLFLHRYDLVAARSLCAALQEAVDEEQNWVFYREAPILPMVREGDLARRGCAIPVTDLRARTARSGQAPWIDLARLLRASSTATPMSRETSVALLHRLSAKDFAALRADPPLLYHGDLRVTRRYYWSTSVGYALWLRLYFETFGSPEPSDLR